MTSPHASDSTTARDEWAYEVVIVSYKSAHLIAPLLETLPADLPVVVVDNARGQDQAQDLVQGRRHGRYVDSGGGRGFAVAANLGAKSSRYEYLVFVNPDALPRLADLDAMVQTLQARPEVASVSALTHDGQGHVEIGVAGWEPSPRRALVHATGLHKLFPTAGLWARPAPGQRIEVDWTSGACLAVRRRVFLELGGFDEDFFVYQEDTAFGRRVREAGLRQVVRSDVLVPHAGAGSGGGSTQMLQLRGAMFVKYVDSRNGSRRGTAIRLLLTAGYAGRLVLCLARGQRGRAREHSAYLRGMWQGPPVIT